MTQASAAAGAAVYSRPVLSIYDFFVLGLSSTFAWRCPAGHILNFYNQHVSANHLDVGVGTGYFLDRCRFPVATPTITLLDLNANSLAVARQRLRRYRPQTIRSDVLAPPPDRLSGFDSIGMNYLLHCLPGTMPEKGVVLKNFKPWLNDAGILFGTTILGQGVKHNALARLLMGLYNRKGIFSNRQDSASDLEDSLGAVFQDVSVHLHGCVAFFMAAR